MERHRLPYFSSSDLNQMPDQCAYKLNYLCDALSEMWQYVYPIGCYFETSDIDFDPNRRWGGNWEEVSTGRWHRLA